MRNNIPAGSSAYGRASVRQRPRPTRIAFVLAAALLLVLAMPGVSYAAVSVSRAELSGDRLRIEGTATPNRTITVDGVAMGTSDGDGRFRIERSGFIAPADCTVDVNDGSATPANVRLTGCTVTTPSTPTPSTLTLSPTSVTGGDPATGSVTLSATAPAGGQAVALTSSNSASASVPASVTVAGGSTSTTFPVTTTSVTTTSQVTITATSGGASRSAVLTVSPAASSSPTLTGLSLNPDTVVEGTNSTGTVALSAAAPTGGVVVALTSGNTSAATVPASVTVPAGDTAASFTVFSGTTASTSSSVITASAGGINRTALFTVTSANPTLSNLTISPLSVTGGSSATGTVTLTAPATGSGITVSLSSDDSTIASVPPSVTVASGDTTASFTITTSPVSTSQSTIIRATHGTASRAFTLSVTPEATGPAVTSVTLSESTVVGGTPVTGTVRLGSTAPPGGTTVLLSSDNTAVATVPATVTVPAGAVTTTFTVETHPTTNSQSALLVAEAGGGRVGAVLTVTTEFDANFGSVSLARGGNGEGRVTSSPAGIDCTFTRTGTTGSCGNAFFPAGTEVRLTARPANNSRFLGWEFEVSCRNAPRVTVQAGVGHICRPVFRLR